MTLKTGLIVCALLATELAGVLCLANYVRTSRKRRQASSSHPHLPTTKA